MAFTFTVYPSRQPQIFRDSGAMRTEYEAFGPEVWDRAKGLQARAGWPGETRRPTIFMGAWLWDTLELNPQGRQVVERRTVQGQCLGLWRAKLRLGSGQPNCKLSHNKWSLCGICACRIVLVECFNPQKCKFLCRASVLGPNLNLKNHTRRVSTKTLEALNLSPITPNRKPEHPKPKPQNS